MSNLIFLNIYTFSILKLLLMIYTLKIWDKLKTAQTKKII